MLSEKLNFIFNQFKQNSQFIAYSELASGHINNTYFIKTNTKPYFVLQQINNGVFKDVPGLINNKIAISLHIKKKLKHLSKKELNRKVLRFLKTKKGYNFFKCNEDNYWCLMYFIDDSITFETVKNKETAYEAGKLFGNFLNLTDDFDAKNLTEVIPKFHDMSFRFSQFYAAFTNASKTKIFKAQAYIDIVLALKEEMHILQKLKETGKIKTRVTHNDTKISNALFTLNNKGLCVIDTDTVMPGIVHYDFGDAIRTICNTAAEDEIDLKLVTFNVNYYNAYKKGFLEKIKNSLSKTEIKYLPLAAKTMIFIMALRFLTDFLNNDIYYKTKYPEHNLDRAKNQFKLMESFSKKINQL